MSYIIWGVLLVIAGASGRFVLRGTNSSAALIGFGFVMVIVGIVTTLINQKKKNANQEQMNALNQQIESGSPPLPNPCQIIIHREKSMVGAAANYEIFLNGASAGLLKNGETLSLYTNYHNNVLNSPMLKGSFEFLAEPNGIINIRFNRTATANGTHFDFFQ